MALEVNRAPASRVKLYGTRYIPYYPAIGFLSMNFSEVPPFHDLGNISATGVAAAWVLSITFLPALIAILPLRVKVRPETSAANAMDKVADFVVSHRRPLLWVGGLAAVLLTALLPLNTLNDQFVDYFDESMAFRRDSDFAMEHLRACYILIFTIHCHCCYPLLVARLYEDGNRSKGTRV